MSQRLQELQQSHTADDADSQRSSMRPLSVLHRHFRATQLDDDDSQTKDAIVTSDTYSQSEDDIADPFDSDEIVSSQITPSTVRLEETKTLQKIAHPTPFNASSSPPEIDEDSAATPMTVSSARSAPSSILRNSYLFITPSKRPREENPSQIPEGPSTTPIAWAKGIKLPKIESSSDTADPTLSPKTTRRKDRLQNGYAQRFTRLLADARSDYAVWQYESEQGKRQSSLTVQIIHQIERNAYQQTSLCRCKFITSKDDLKLNSGDEILVLFTKGHSSQLHLTCRKGDYIEIWLPWKEIQVHENRCFVVSRARLLP